VCRGALVRRLAAVVQEFGCGIESVRPDDGAGLEVNADLAEVFEVSQGFAEGATQQERTVDIAGDSIAKRHAQAVAVKWLYVRYSENGHMLRQRLDRDERLG